VFQEVLRRLRLQQKKLGVGLRRPCRVKACCGMLGAMARCAHAKKKHFKMLKTNYFDPPCSLAAL
jgi:hypothetical protein